MTKVSLAGLMIERIFDHVVETATIPAGFKRQVLPDLIIHTEHALMLLVRLQARAYTLLKWRASRASSRERTEVRCSR